MSEPPRQPPEDPAPAAPTHRLDPDAAAAAAGAAGAAESSAAAAADAAARGPGLRPGQLPSPAIDTRPYRWMIGIFGLVLVILISVYQFARNGVGSPGVGAGSPLHLFVAPLATRPLNRDANVHPRCDPAHPNPDGLNVCGRRSLVLGFFVAGSDACRREIDTIQAVSREFASSPIQFAAVAVRASRSDTAALVRSHHWTIPVAYDRDGALGDLYGVQICPMVEMSRPGGTVANRLIGEHWLSATALAAQVRRTLVR